jgi:hypothetical protein
MAIITNNTTPTSGAATLLTIAPGDVYDLVVVNNAGQVVYVGTSTSVTSSNGCPIPAGQSVRLSGLGGGAQTPLYVIAASGAISGSVGYILSTPM